MKYCALKAWFSSMWCLRLDSLLPPAPIPRIWASSARLTPRPFTSRGTHKSSIFREEELPKTKLSTFTCWPCTEIHWDFESGVFYCPAFSKEVTMINDPTWADFNRVPSPHTWSKFTWLLHTVRSFEITCQFEIECIADFVTIVIKF